jgi:hypothetical protein
METSKNFNTLLGSQNVKDDGLEEDDNINMEIGLPHSLDGKLHHAKVQQ